ncbi:MAG: branched-chain amino acid ABC transporter permease [Deltaproteobacteria bacterium]|nr:branched-chain amino acid ABC transporter permease [Deltaproteobacteria bacterium]MBW2530981.1 branched-chain amino acid ABC transporter permease [Deltaproteobacteria bacterium]
MSHADLKRDYREDLTLFEGPISRGLAVAFVAALVLYAQLLAGDFAVFLLMNVALFVVAAIGLNLLVGYTGQISLGHAAFLALGAYTHVILYSKGGPLPVTILAGAVVAGAFGLLVGVPALRLKGPYLAIATLGFQVTVDQVLGRWDSVTGGRMGLGVPYPEIAGVSLASPRTYAMICLAAAVLVVIATVNLTRSRVGRAFVALRDNETAAEAMGVGLASYKTLAFALSAFITGLAGALYAHLFDRINPSTFSLLMSIELLVMVLVGGLGSVLGSVLGATLLVLLPHAFASYRDYQSILVGVILVAVLLFEPMGMRGRWLRIKYYFKAWPF